MTGWGRFGVRGAAVGLVVALALLATGCAGLRPAGEARDGRAAPCQADEGTPLAADTLFAGPAEVTALAADGRPRHAFRISVALAPIVAGICAAGVRLQVAVRDPASGTVVARTVAVTDVALRGGQLDITAGGPVSRDTRLFFAAGALRRADGGGSAPARLTVDGPLSPAQAALWFKAYVPSDHALFPKTFFYRSSANPRLQKAAPVPALRPAFTSDAALLAALKTHYERFIRAGHLTQDRARRYLALVHDPTARRVFIGPDGIFRPLLMAAVLANAGTIGEPAIAALIGGDNVTGRPARVLFDATIQGHLAETGVAGGRLIVRINPRQALGEPFALLAPIIGTHEAFHQDNRVGRNEEVIASYAGIVAAAQQYLADPALAYAGTRLSKVLNARILAMLNSGRGAFPYPGLLPAPLRQPVAEVFPGSINAGLRPSLDAFTRHLYAHTPKQDTAGNPYADRVLGAILERPVSGMAFDRATIRLLDAHSRALDADEQFELLRILKLRPAP